MSTLPEIKTAIIERRGSAREGLAALLKGTPGYRLTGLFDATEEARDKLDLYSPDVLLLCLEARERPAVRIREIKDRYPALQILLLSGTEARGEIFAAIAAGATGYLSRDTPPARLLYAIRELRDGGAPMSPGVARIVVDSLRAPAEEKALPTRLSRREQDTLRLLAEGHSYKTAAATMGVSVDTVRFHVRNIYEKLHVHSKLEAVLKATREGLVP